MDEDAEPVGTAELPAAETHPLALAVERWWAEEVGERSDGPIPYLTGAWHHLFAAKERLKDTLRGIG